MVAYLGRIDRQEQLGLKRAAEGKADRIWVMDRGMISQANIAFLKEGGRRYIVGTPKGKLRKFERQLLSDDWQSVHEGSK